VLTFHHIPSAILYGIKLNVQFQELATSKMAMAQKEFDFEQLHLSYILLEKSTCLLKLENAKLRAQIDEFKGLPPDIRKLELNGAEEMLFQDDANAFDFEIAPDVELETDMMLNTADLIAKENGGNLNSSPTIPGTDLIRTGFKNLLSLVPSGGVKYNEASSCDYQSACEAPD